MNGLVAVWRAASATVMVMASYSPTSDGPGVPVMRPLLGSKLAQGGRFSALKVSLSPSGSLAAGLKLVRHADAGRGFASAEMVGAWLVVEGAGAGAGAGVGDGQNPVDPGGGTAASPATAVTEGQCNGR